jgi:hypothetical protein
MGRPEIYNVDRKKVCHVDGIGSKSKAEKFRDDEREGRSSGRGQGDEWSPKPLPWRGADEAKQIANMVGRGKNTLFQPSRPGSRRNPIVIERRPSIEHTIGFDAVEDGCF